MIPWLLQVLGCCLVAQWLVQALSYGRVAWPRLTEAVVAASLAGWLALLARVVGV